MKSKFALSLIAAVFLSSVGAFASGADSASPSWLTQEEKCSLKVFQGDTPSPTRYKPVSNEAADPFDDCILAASLNLYMTEATNEVTGETFFINEPYRDEIEKNTRVVITYILDDDSEFERVSAYLAREFNFRDAAKMRHARDDGRWQLVLNYKKRLK